MKGSVVITGDKVYAGIVEDEIVAIDNAIVIEFSTQEDMQEALRDMALTEGFQQGMLFSQSLPPINAELSAAVRLLQSIPSEEAVQISEVGILNPLHNIDESSYYVMDLNDVLEPIFKEGVGVLTITGNMPDAAILLSIRDAVRMADGKPFTVLTQ
jgi:hypothetical protein